MCYQGRQVEAFARVTQLHGSDKFHPTPPLSRYSLLAWDQPSQQRMMPACFSRTELGGCWRILESTGEPNQTLKICDQFADNWISGALRTFLGKEISGGRRGGRQSRDQLVY